MAANGKHLAQPQRFNMDEPAEAEVKLPLRLELGVWAVILALLLTAITVQIDRGNVRRELSENAQLIKQVQERQLVRELTNLKRADR